MAAGRPAASVSNSLLSLCPGLVQHPALPGLGRRGAADRKPPEDPTFLHTLGPAQPWNCRSQGLPEGSLLRLGVPSPPPRAPVTWGSGEAPPGGGITPLAMARGAAWEPLAHRGTGDQSEKKGALRGPRGAPWRRRAGSGFSRGRPVPAPGARSPARPSAGPRPATPGHPGPPAPARRAPPRPAVYLGAPGRAGPGRAAAPHLPPAFALGPVGAQGRTARGGARGLGEPGRPGGRRRRSPQPATPPPRARLRSSAAAAAAGPHNGSGRAVTQPAPAGPAPTRGPPQEPTCSPAPSPGAPRIPRGECRALHSHKFTPHLTFNLPFP